MNTCHFWHICFGRIVRTNIHPKQNSFTHLFSSNLRSWVAFALLLGSFCAEVSNTSCQPDVVEVPWRRKDAAKPRLGDL